MAGLWPAGWQPAPDTDLVPAAALVLTVALPAAVQGAAEAVRRRFDPARAARTPAHLSLFRHLPGPQARALLADLRALAGPAPRFRLMPPRRVEGALWAPVMGPDLDALREALAGRWHGLLLPGDAAPARLHLTLAAEFPARDALPPPLPPGPHRAPGLLLWRHLGPQARGEPFWSPLVAVGFRP